MIRNWSRGLNPFLYKVIYSSLSTLTVMDFTGTWQRSWGWSQLHQP